MRKNTAKILLLLFLSATFVFVGGIGRVSADAWWGYGYRTPKWVLSHGGTIIYYEIENISGEGNEYKAVMYDEDGDYVEKEFGKKAVFDDAKNGVYKISAYRGGTKNKLTYKGGKKFASITVTAHPGETIKIKFNYKKKSAKMTTDYVKPVPKPVAKKAAPSAPEPEVEPAAEVQEEVEEISEPSLQDEALMTTEENENQFDEFMEAYVHPDAMAEESGERTVIRQKDSNQQTIAEEVETENIFVIIWTAVKKFFGFG